MQNPLFFTFVHDYHIYRKYKQTVFISADGLGTNSFLLKLPVLYCLNSIELGVGG